MSKPVVLIVEDSSDSIQVLANALTDGYQVSVCVDVKDAWELIVKQKPKLVLLDIELGDESGFLLLAKMKELPAAKRMPVVVISAHSTQMVQLKAIELGAWSFLRKPVDAELLRGLVDRLANLGKRNRRSQSFLLIGDSYGPLDSLSHYLFLHGCSVEIRRSVPLVNDYFATRSVDHVVLFMPTPDALAGEGDQSVRAFLRQAGSVAQRTILLTDTTVEVESLAYQAGADRVLSTGTLPFFSIAKSLIGPLD